MSAPALDDYVEVPDRIRQFKEKYPEGSLRGSWTLVELPRANGDVGPHIVYTATAHRHPEDHAPGIGTATEPVPGMTPYTKGSEMMNAETSAWGRALVALGFVSKKVASANEVRARQDVEAKPKAQPKRLSGDERVRLAKKLEELKVPSNDILTRVQSYGAEKVEDLTHAQAKDLVEFFTLKAAA